MDMFKTMDISASALTAERFRMDVIAENIANANTTRTAEGGPYRRRYTVFESRAPQFHEEFNNALSQMSGSGVRVSQVGEDQTPFKLDYNPEHPDADEDGYVRLPNVDTVREMVDMMAATRSYEANITLLNATKAIASKALEIGK